MAKGWKEYRLDSDGRWMPTGQLRDAFPYGENGIVVPGAPAPRTFYRVDGIDSTDGRVKVIFVAGDAPPGDPPQPPLHTFGWSSFTSV